MGEFTPCQPDMSRLMSKIDSRIIKIMISTWKITKAKSVEIHFDDESSLDSITRQLPDGFYSTFRTFNSCTRVIGLSAHLRRLPHADGAFLRRNLNQLLEPYRPEETRVRIMETKRGQFYISIEPLKLLPREVYEKGVRVETTTIERHDPRVKTTAFISKSTEEREYLAQTGIFEALLVKNGRILEGMTSNFFYMMEPIDMPIYVGTARRDILLGVTRTMVIRAARSSGVDVRYTPLKLDQLSAVKEAFITSSSRGIVPIIQIDNVRVGQGSPGWITKLLMQAYQDAIQKNSELI